jgi:DHA1 family purine ribonucleoside efflux pump-like MFS transporter
VTTTPHISIALGAFTGGLLIDGAGVHATLIAGGIAALIGSVVIVLVKPRPQA